MSDQKNMHGAKAIEKIQEIADENRFTMLCTNLSEFPFSTCPMTVQKVEDDGTIWFFSGADSEHNADIKNDNRAQLIFSKPKTDEYLSLAGAIHISTDRKKIEELWNPFVKAWFPDGKEDPNLTLLRFQPESGQYWDTKNGRILSTLKYMAAAFLTNEKADVGVQGKLTV